MSGDLSPIKIGSSEEPFRRLSKNDIYQTTEQWRERTIMRLGEVSGQWAAWVDVDQVPKVPSVRPEPPIKPSSEALMLHLKGELRAQRLRELNEKEAKAAEAEGKTSEPKTLDAIPMPGDYEIWSRYESAREQYQHDLEDYKRLRKEALETFPLENRKVFSTLIKCISDASVQDLKRTAEGADLFTKHDAYGFFKLAIQEHEYLPPSISSAAVARAKDEFEKYQQKSEDSITEHINEFRRRYEALLKARGPDGGSPYMDFDLRDLLLNSLYKPVWAAWIASREATDTMPVGFEALVLALKRAESTMILKGPSSMDMHMPTAHATRSERGSEPSTPSTPLPPNKCSVCGVTFCPKRSTHVRCDPCQEKFAAQKKKERKKKGSTGKKVKSKTAHVHKKAHATHAKDESDSESDESEDEDEEGTANATSYSCICATRSTSPVNLALVYFDNCSNLNIIKDKELAIDIRTEKVTTRISGSIPGSLASNKSAAIGDLGRGCFDPLFSRNLISESAVIKAGYRVQRDSGTDNNYYLIKEGRPPLVFKANAEGTYSTTAKEIIAHFKDLYATANLTDVRRETVVFTRRQRERAAQYNFDHSHCLGHLHHDRVIKALRTGMITDVPYTEADVRNALVIYGECPTCSRTKGTKHRQTGTYPVLPTYPGERLAGDLFTIMGILFSVISCRLIKMRCVTKLQNKGAMEVTRAIRETVDIWKGYGSKPRVLSWDQEPAIVSCAAEIWSKHSLRMEFTPPEGHERVAEREVRTIKEHVYSSILSLNHAVDEEMVEGIVRDTVTLLNFMPNSETLEVSPRSILDGERLNYSRWSRVYAGQVAEFEVPYVNQNKRGTRREIGYVISHQGDNPVVRLLPSGKRLVIRSGHVKIIDKSPAIIHLIEQGITGAKRRRYNDLLAEIAEYYAGLDDDDSAARQEPLALTLPDRAVELADPPARQATERNLPLEELAQQPSSLEQMPPRNSPLEQMPPQSSPATPLTPAGPSNPRDEATPIEPSPTLMVSLPDSASENIAPRRAPELPETERRKSSRQAAQKPPGYYAKLNKGESVADYTACHMRASECERLYGKEATLDAGLSEVTNMIGRGAAVPQDFRQLSPRVIEEALPSFLFYKAKEEIVDLDTPTTAVTCQTKSSEEQWQVVKPKKARKKAARKRTKIKGRWVGGGHRQIRSEVLAERVAPTARSATHSIVMAIAAFEGRKLHVGDIPAAYLQADHVPANGRPVYIIADKHTTELVVKAYPETANLVRPNGTMILKVAKAMYGLVESAWLWYKELEKHLVGLGYTVSTSDRALFFKSIYRKGKLIASNIASVHVDDIVSAASNNEEGKALEEEFWSSMDAKWPGIKRQRGPHYKHLSWNIYQDPESGEIRKSQRDYLLEVVNAAGDLKEQKLPSRCDLLSSDPNSPVLQAKEISAFRSTLQKVAYAREGRPDFDFVVSYLQGKQSAPTEQDWKDLQHLLGYVKRVPEREVIFKPTDLQLRAYADAAFNITQDGRSHYGYVVTLGHALICTKGGRVKTVVRSSTEAEITAVNEVVSDLLWCRDILEELGYLQKAMPIREDNQSCITMLQQEPRNFQSKSKHVRVKWAFFRQEYAKRTLYLKYCPTSDMVADLLTKPLGGKSHNRHSTKLFSGV